MADIDYPIKCIATDGYRENPERGSTLHRAEDGTPWIVNLWPETKYTFEIRHPALSSSEQLELEQFYEQHIGDEVRWFNPRRQSWWRVRMVGPPRLSSMRSGLLGDVDMTLVGEMVDAPTNYTRPVVSGLHQIGQVITVSQGAWESEYPMQFEYQWLRNGEPIAGATDQNYTLVDDDLFNMISVRVTASSFGGSTSVETEPVMARLDAEVSWLYSDMAETIFVDTSGNTPATWGDPVGLIKDSSGNGNDFTQPTVTARPILRNDPPRLEFDLTDDNLTTTLPAIESGTVVIAGTNGIWIDDDYNFDGGTFSIGTTSYTNGLDGILTAIGEPIVGGFLVINRQLSQLERELVIQELKERGAPGVFELGPELADPSAWSALTGNLITWLPDGRAEFTANGPVAFRAGQLLDLIPGRWYTFTVDVEAVTSYATVRTFSPTWSATTGRYFEGISQGERRIITGTFQAREGEAILGAQGPHEDGGKFILGDITVRQLELIP